MMESSTIRCVSHSISGLQLSELAGRNSVLPLEGPKKGGVIRKAHPLVHLVQWDALNDQRFGRNKPPLGDTAVKTDAQLLAEGLADFALADPEVLRGVRQRDLLPQRGIDIGQRRSLLPGQGPGQQRQKHHRLPRHDRLPPRTAAKGLLHTGVDAFPQRLPRRTRSAE